MDRTQARRIRQIPERNTGRRSWPTRRKIRLVGVILLVVVFTGLALLWLRLASFNERTSTAPAMSISLIGPLAFGSEPVNILVLGYGGTGHDGPFLTDSINIVSIDPSTSVTTMLPVPRDVWIEGMPEIPGNGKINLAFSLGHASGGVVEGSKRALQVVEAVTGLPIAHWIAIDFDGFRSVIDAIGGVSIDNPTEFSYGSPEDFDVQLGWDGTFPAGSLDLSGEEALLYARTRYTSDPAESTDYARSERQQRILRAVVEKVTGPGLSGVSRGLTAMDALDDHLGTDLSVIDLIILSGNLTPDRRIELSEGTVLEATTTTDGQYVLVPIGRSSPEDYSPLQRYIEAELAAPMPSSAH